MNDVTIAATAVIHAVYAVLYGSINSFRTVPATATWRGERDRGAVSLEQVLWFVAAGVSVAVIAAILWNKIRDEANTPVQTPSAP
jgi:succinate dehydrogenase/fumarate reductase cytochrome b subunit